VQFDPLKTILVFSHNHNTFDKKELLDRGDGPTQQPDKNITVSHFMNEEGEIYDFFMKNIDELLAEYKPGSVENKPEVLQQMKTMNDYREKEQMELIEIRKKAMLDQEVEKVLAQVKEQERETHDKYIALSMINMRLIKKMKLLNEKVKSIDLDDETQTLIKAAESDGIQVDMGLKDFRIEIIQKDELCNIDPQSVHNLLEFVRRGATISGSVILNNTSQYDITNQQVEVIYRPHPSKQQDVHILQELSRRATGIATQQQQPYNSQNTDKQIEISSEDINTVMEQGECNEPTAKRALYNENNDVISAIMNIENYTCDSFEIPSPTTQNQPMAPTQLLESVDKDDVDTVMEQAECNEITARNALAHEEGDVITAIMNIDKYTCSDNASTGSENNTNPDNTVYLNKEDIQTVMTQAKCDETTAINAFLGESQDIVSAVMNIDKYMTTAENNIIQSSENIPENNNDNSEDITELDPSKRRIIKDIKFIEQYHKIPHHVAKIAYYNEGRDLAKALNNYKKYEHLTEIDRADHPNNIGQVMMTSKCNVETSKKLLLDCDGDIAQAAMDALVSKNVTVPTPENIDVCNQEYIDIVRSITLCSEETAKNALTKTNGDVLHCITDENISEYVVDETKTETETEPIEMVIEEESSIASDRA
jgi:NACalpha-BTF3-like transcription factor